MALATSPPLLELRQALAIRLNLGKQASTSKRLHPLLDEWLRSSFELLVREANWIVLRVTEDMELVTGQHAYDVPDSIDVGSIEEITVMDEDFMEWRIEPGINVHERNAYRVDRGGEYKESQASVPLRWEVIDQMLHIYPAPDDRFLTMKIRGKAIPRAPYSDGDRAYIDKEAHLLQATLLGKDHFKMPGINSTAATLQRHLTNMRSAQSDGEPVVIGGSKSARFEDRGGWSGADRRLFYPDYDPDYAYAFRHGYCW